MDAFSTHRRLIPDSDWALGWGRARSTGEGFGEGDPVSSSGSSLIRKENSCDEDPTSKTPAL